MHAPTDHFAHIHTIDRIAATVMACFHDKHAKDARVERWISWHPSREDKMILNVDGSGFGNPGRAGFGGLIRNIAEGEWITGFGGFIGISDNLHAELLAILHGLNRMRERGYRDVICYTDSMLAINLIIKGPVSLHRYARIVQQKRDLISQQNWEVKLLHTPSNHCADFSAKLGATQDDAFKIFDTPPAELSILAGVEFLRN